MPADIKVKHIQISKITASMRWYCGIGMNKNGIGEGKRKEWKYVNLKMQPNEWYE